MNLLPGVAHPLSTQRGKQIKPCPLRFLVPCDQKGWQECLGSLWSEVLELRGTGRTDVCRAKSIVLFRQATWGASWLDLRHEDFTRFGAATLTMARLGN